MKVIKRDGSEAQFNSEKIIIAITKANNSVTAEDKLTPDIIEKIAKSIEYSCAKLGRAPSVEEIQNMVEHRIMETGHYTLAKNYITYRYQRAMTRSATEADERILSLVNQCNEDIKQENSNKNPSIVSTQRDYIAGETSKDISDRLLLPSDIVEADKEGIIHFHDKDYFIVHEANCCLVNLEDMLQNGTVISDTKIEKPHSFSTACNIATQIIAQVASSQYGGQSISLSHLAPFVDVSRQVIKEKLVADLSDYDVTVSEDVINSIVEKQVKREIEKGVQIIQYQILTLLTTNGQTPFVTIFMYLNEVTNQKTKDDLALIIEEVLKQRMQGVKNEQGVWITPAFPKLIYVLEEDNLRPNDKYYYLTELAAQCTAKRMVPDYVSEKKMKEYKEGNCFPPMGCVDKDEVITYKYNERMYVESISRMWERLSDRHDVLLQSKNSPHKYMPTHNVEIYDSKKGFVKVKQMVKNYSNNWMNITFSNGRSLKCTTDHPLPIIGKGRTFAGNTQIGDKVPIISTQFIRETENMPVDLAWAYGVILCDGCYDQQFSVTTALTDEDEISDLLIPTVCNRFGIDGKEIEWHRDEKGNYKEIRFNYTSSIINHLIKLFGGIKKIDRHIPSVIFNSALESRLAFIGGMIDADGYINDSGSHSTLQIGSTNKELAIQQMLLLQSVGIPAKIYKNKYNKSSASIRYRVECDADVKLIKYVMCEKKRSHFGKERTLKYDIPMEAEITNIEFLDEIDWSYDVTTESDFFDVSGIYSHNCRSMLAPWIDENGNYKFYGRFNQGVVTINLVDVALSSKGNYEDFWKIFDTRLELCYKGLMCRHNRLKGTVADVAPILWRYGALARLEHGETIDKLLYGGYSSISLGYAGLYECVKYMTGLSHSNPDATPFALKVMEFMNNKCNEWKKKTNIGFAMYGTPIESTTYKFAKCLQKRFGIIPDITDKNYITNSYHINVKEKINAFDKLKIESQFQHLSTGGAVSYVEVPNMQNNIPAVIAVMQYIYDNIMYAELNTKSDYCEKCGYDGEIKIIEDEDGKLIWECPSCGNHDQSTMSVVRRTCGYLGSQFWNQGRTQEIKDRVLHL